NHLNYNTHISSISFFNTSHNLFLIIIPTPPISTLFPYTTLFRSALFFAIAMSLSSTLNPLLKNVFDRERPTLLRLIDISVKYVRSEEHTSELQSRFDLVCCLLLEKKKIYIFQSGNTAFLHFIF